ncbi:MAG: OadG family transporter subunit [Bacillota bacterium]|nr:OadG family transporter subunit [Bacillota bacterium]
MGAIFMEGLQVTILGIAVVLLGLYGLVLVLQIQEKLLSKDKKNEATEAIMGKKTAVIQKTDGLDETVAVVTAVMSEILDNNEAVVNIRQLN